MRSVIIRVIVRGGICGGYFMDVFIIGVGIRGVGGRYLVSSLILFLVVGLIDFSLELFLNIEEYNLIDENFFKIVKNYFFLIFFIDVDIVFYSNLCCFIIEGWLLLKDVVRIEELINYFIYNYF